MTTPTNKQLFFRITRLIFAAIAFAVTISSCCTKMGCEGFEDMRSITFSGFEPSELDSIAIVTFENKTTGTIQIDSAMYNGRSGSVSNNSIFAKDRYYEITLLSTGQEYKLGGFITKRKSCNCKIIKKKSDLYDSLENYYINGQKQSRGYVLISK